MTHEVNYGLRFVNESLVVETANYCRGFVALVELHRPGDRKMGYFLDFVGYEANGPEGI